jgi:hypothetical protein
MARALCSIGVQGGLIWHILTLVRQVAANPFASFEAQQNIPGSPLLLLSRLITIRQRFGGPIGWLGGLIESFILIEVQGPIRPINHD